MGHAKAELKKSVKVDEHEKMMELVHKALMGAQQDYTIADSNLTCFQQLYHAVNLKQPKRIKDLLDNMRDEHHYYSTPVTRTFLEKYGNKLKELARSQAAAIVQ
jgi:hypothetical protein